MPVVKARQNLFSSGLIFSVDYRRAFLYKETLNRRHQANREVPQRVTTHETDGQQADVLVAESHFAKPLTVLCATKNKLRQTETGGFKQNRFPFLFYRPDTFS